MLTPRAPLLALLLAGCGGSTPQLAVPSVDSGVHADDDGDDSCEVSARAPRQLRLLTRAEYARTVDDLFRTLADEPAASCSSDLECDLSTESCEANVCTPLPCGTAGFYLSGDQAGDASEVVLAGDFNGWGPTTAEGGWPMAWDEAADGWRARYELGEGRWTYKFVVDGARWLQDPGADLQEDDGYGGQNSVRVVDCVADRRAPWLDVDPEADFPVESRPQHYPFDNSAESGLVTANHLTAYTESARVLAEVLVEDPGRYLGCDSISENCAQEGIVDLMALAWRRPPSSAERDRVLAVLASASDPATGLRLAARVVLASPHFLYRSELGVEQADGTYRLTDHELATALAYGLWGTMPDEELRALADSGALSDGAVRAEQARRLLADPRGRDHLARFANQWLGTERLATATRNEAVYPDFDPALRAALAQEAGQAFAWHALDGAGTVGATLTADTTWADARLADHYGVARPDGGRGMVPLPGERAGGGLVSMASVLAATAHSDQTSPVRRGLLVRERLLCQSLGVPPANAGGVPDVDPSASTRERFEQHSSDPSCSGCHRFIDPVGFGLEHYDALGAWRDTDAGHAIDASGELVGIPQLSDPEVYPFEGPAQLASVLAESDAVAQCLSTMTWRWAHGREEADDESCGVEDAAAAFAAGDQVIVDLLVDVLSGDGFAVRAGGDR